MLLFDKISTQGLRLILASQSPRRRELMQGANLPFEVAIFDVEESFPADMPAEQVPEYLAHLKGAGYPSPLEESEILITADTVVIHRGEILGKPKSAQDARAMLSRLSGGEHKVITGVAIRSSQRCMSFSCESLVRFATLSQQEVDFYVDRYSPLDKAGSYGIQEWIGYVGIESIEGSFYNVMGLPIQRLYRELNKFITSVLDKNLLYKTPL